MTPLPPPARVHGADGYKQNAYVFVAMRDDARHETGGHPVHAAQVLRTRALRPLFLFFFRCTDLDHQAAHPRGACAQPCTDLIQITL